MATWQEAGDRTISIIDSHLGRRRAFLSEYCLPELFGRRLFANQGGRAFSDLS